MNFKIDGRCTLIRHDNLAVDLDLNFVNETGLHALDLSGPDVAVAPINVNQTFGGDWLLEAAVDNEETCAALPTTYDNDYHSIDTKNPDAIP